jgi:hypothetical protein
MAFRIPGKVLVIENDYKQISALIRSLWVEGQGVVWFDTIPEETAIPCNIRMLVLDLVLRDDGTLDRSDYQQAALLLRDLCRKTYLYLVAVWSVHVGEDDKAKHQVIQELKEAYREIEGEEMPKEVAIRAFGKRGVSHSDLLLHIARWIEDEPEIGLVFEWERSLEVARDAALASFVNQAGIRTTIAQIDRELGTESVPRELSGLLMRVLSRLVAQEVEAHRDDFTPLVSATKKAAAPAVDAPSWYPNFHNLRAYSEPNAAEPTWTGDIYDTGEDDLEKRFVIVITPPCDLARQKVMNFRLACCTWFCRLGDYAPDAEDVPVIVKKLRKTQQGKYKKPKDAAEALIRGHFVKAGGKMVHMVVDFSMVCYVPSGEFPSAWVRICRVDSPFMEDLLQKYAAFSSRVGVPEFPENVADREKRRLLGNSS